jgi:hypothetical protein
MAQPSLMELSTRIERAAIALRRTERMPTASQLVVVTEDLGRTHRHLARAVQRWSEPATRAGSAASASSRSARDGLHRLVADLHQCADTAAAARDALLDLGRST